MRVELPESFEKRMQEMLGDEIRIVYRKLIDNPRPVGLRDQSDEDQRKRNWRKAPVFLWIRFRGQRPGIFIKKKISRPDIHITVPVFIICRSQAP